MQPLQKNRKKKRREVHVCTQHTKLPHASIHNAYSEQQHDEEEALTQSIMLLTLQTAHSPANPAPTLPHY